MNHLKPKYNVQLVAKRGAHYYGVEGVDALLPGVTTVLGVIAKPALIPWAAKQAAEKIKVYLMTHAVNRTLTAHEIAQLVEEGRKHPEILKDEAADLGTRAHQAINAIIEGGEPVITPDIKPCVDAFMDFVEKDSLEIGRGDTKIASLEHGYGGSLDAVGMERGKLVIVDFKTSSGIWPEYALQVAAYAQAFRETYGLDYTPEGLILRVGKAAPDFEVKRVRSIEDSFKRFRAALDLYRSAKDEAFRAA